MNNLVEVVNNQVVVSSRMVAERFGKRQSDVLRDIDNIITQNCVLTSRISTMFCESYYQAGTGKRYREVLMNREGFTLLAMGFNGAEALEWKVKFMDAFMDMEEQLKDIFKIPKTYAEALQLAATQAEELEEKTKQLDVAKPKVEFYNNYVDRGSNICLRDLGKRLDKPPTKFQELLRKEGYLRANNSPYQRYIDTGLFVIRTVTVYGHSQTFATPKAVLYFGKKYKNWTA